jgi:hypothetical protein
MKATILDTHGIILAFHGLHETRGLERVAVRLVDQRVHDGFRDARLRVTGAATHRHQGHKVHRGRKTCQGIFFRYVRLYVSLNCLFFCLFPIQNLF